MTAEVVALQDVKMVVCPITQERSPAKEEVRLHLPQDYPYKTVVNKVMSHGWPSIAVFSTPTWP